MCLSQTAIGSSLCQINPVHILTHYFLNGHFNIILPFRNKSQICLLPLSFPTAIFTRFSDLPHALHPSPSVLEVVRKNFIRSFYFPPN